MPIIYSLSGQVHKSKGRGKQLGFPTANIPLNVQIEDGLYVGYTKIDENKFPALIFVGAAVTFGENERKAEIYLLDYQDNLYDKTIHVDIFQKLRDNCKFNSKEELIEQMKEDERQARILFKDHSFMTNLSTC